MAVRTLALKALLPAVLLLAAPSARAETRLALVIQQADYRGTSADLPGTAEEARLMSEALKATGFTVTHTKDRTKSGLEADFAAFETALKSSGADTVAFIYYTGHGAQNAASTSNVLIPVDALIRTPEDVSASGVDLEAVRTRFDGLGLKAVFLVFDACRNVPDLDDNPDDGKGIARVDPETGLVMGLMPLSARTNMLIGYSTGQGTIAREGAFAPVLAAVLRQPYQGAVTAFAQVQRRVGEATGRTQLPWSNNLLQREVCFTSCAPEALLATGTEAGLKRVQAEAILASFGWEGIPVEMWGDRLAESAARLRELEARLASASTGDTEVDRLLRTAPAAIEAADFARADTLLAGAQAIDIAAGKHRINPAIETMEQRADLAASEGRYEDAADHYLSASDLVPRSSGLKWARLKFNEALVAAESGRFSPERAMLTRSVTAYRQVLNEYTRERVPLKWAMTQNNLGNVLTTLGERGDDVALAQAVTAFREALKEYTRERVPQDWAMTQNNLGTALRLLADRGDDSALAEAIAAYTEVLKERTRERLPLGWAATQNNLGNALAMLGERGDTDALTEAVTAYREALKEYTRERVPLDWAMVQNNLGTVLHALGEEGHDEALSDAVMAYREALKERTRERAPLAWAATQNNLGNALATLGERGDDEALAEAISAYREALKEYTRERVPLDWAMVQNNLGTVLEVIGERGDETALAGAIAAYERSLEVWTAQRAPYDHEMASENLARAKALLAARE